jgi:hypothetical protein
MLLTALIRLDHRDLISSPRKRADSFRSGRMFLGGDAVHLFTPHDHLLVWYSAHCRPGWIIDRIFALYVAVFFLRSPLVGLLILALQPGAVPPLVGVLLLGIGGETDLLSLYGFSLFRIGQIRHDLRLDFHRCIGRQCRGIIDPRVGVSVNPQLFRHAGRL